MSIEVEHKFSIRADTRERLEGIGACKEGCCSFSDTYYDTCDHTVTLRDYWLRKRDGKWQLKSPLQIHSLKPATDQYKETETEHEILQLLRNAEIIQQDTPLDRLVSDNVISPIATYTTTRETWLLKDPDMEGLSGMNVVLDSTDDGYSVGEVEVMVTTPSLAPPVERVVREVAENIGDASVAIPGGKLSYHLSKNDSTLWQLLIDHHVMRKP